MFCRNCGAELPDGSAFCSNCGSSTELPEQPQGAEYAAPQASPAAEAYPGVEVPDFAPQPQKKRGKRMLIAVIAAVLCVALLAGGLVYAFVYNTPERKLGTAFGNTYDALGELFEDCDNLERMEEIWDERQEKGAFGMTAQIDMAGGIISLGMEENISLPQKQAGVDLWLRSDYMGMDFLFRGVLEETQGTFGMPGVLTQNLTVPYENLAESARNSEAFQDAEWDEDLESTFQQLESGLKGLFQNKPRDTDQTVEDALREFLASAKITKVNEPIEAATDSLTVYALETDWAAKLAPLAEVFEEPEFGKDLKVYAGVNDDGCVTALKAVDGDDVAMLALNGRENLWNEIALSVNGQTATITMEKSANGVVCDIAGACTITCNDAAGEITIAYGGESYVLAYGVANGELQIGADLSIEGMPLEISLTMGEMGEIEPLEKGKNPFEMTKEELTAIGAQIEAAFSNGMTPFG